MVCGVSLGAVMLVAGGVVGPPAAWSPAGSGVIVVAGCNPTSAGAIVVVSPVLGWGVAA
jgi:hypothetical protein